MEKLTIVKVGGKIVEDDKSLKQLLDNFSKIKGYKLLVHGGGRLATQLAEQLGIESKMVDGRRITSIETLKVVTMVYGGLINKNIVAKLQAIGIDAIGLTGADMNIMLSEKRLVTKIDYGYVGDVKSVSTDKLYTLLMHDIVPVLAPLTHDGQGNMLNTNADTIASEAAKALAKSFSVELIFCFEKAGVLMSENDEKSVISELNKNNFSQLVKDKIIQDGMIPKLENAFEAIEAGVDSVVITQASKLGEKAGTRIF